MAQPGKMGFEGLDATVETTPGDPDAPPVDVDYLEREAAALEDSVDRLAAKVRAEQDRVKAAKAKLANARQMAKTARAVALAAARGETI